MPGQDDPRSFAFGQLPQNQPASPVLDFLIRALSVGNGWGAGPAFLNEELERRKGGNVQGAEQIGFNAQGENAGEAQIPATAVHKRGSFGSALQSLGLLDEPKAEPLDASEKAGADWGAHLRRQDNIKREMAARKEELAVLKLLQGEHKQAADAYRFDPGFARGRYPEYFKKPGTNEDLPVSKVMGSGESAQRRLSIAGGNLSERRTHDEVIERQNARRVEDTEKHQADTTKAQKRNWVRQAAKDRVANVVKQIDGVTKALSAAEAFQKANPDDEQVKKDIVALRAQVADAWEAHAVATGQKFTPERKRAIMRMSTPELLHESETNAAGSGMYNVDHDEADKALDNLGD